jgi:cytochrome b involved in lipid metabolism
VHGKYYDLDTFMKSHPGGTVVLKMSKGIEDATPLFESYHAFANRGYIAKTMAPFEVSYIPEDHETRTKTSTKCRFPSSALNLNSNTRVQTHLNPTASTRL